MHLIHTQNRAVRQFLVLFVGAVVLLFVGCSGTSDSPPTPDSTPIEPSGPVRLLVVDDPELASVIERQWRAQSDIVVEVRQATTEELLKLPPRNLKADAIIYPSGLLGGLAERSSIAPVPERELASDEAARNDVLAFDRRAIVTWGKTVYAFSFGSPQFVLMYRADIFEQLNLTPPQSWSEYQQLAVRLSSRKELGDLAPPAEETWSATAEPLAPGWAGQMLLARAAPYVRHRSRYSALFKFTTMEPLVDGEPFVRALEELVAAAKYGPANSEQLSPHDARRQLLSGKCAMAVTWPSGASESPGADEREPQRMNVSFAMLPGSTSSYNFTATKWEPRRADDDPFVPLLGVAGRLGSVTTESQSPAAALQMLMLLTSEDLSRQISPHSHHTTIFRSSHLAQSDIWVDREVDSHGARQYADVISDTQALAVWLDSLRIPGRSQYLAALDEAVHQSLAGEKTPADALRAAAERWREITEQIGVDAQRQAYQRSLGQEP